MDPNCGPVDDYVCAQEEDGRRGIAEDPLTHVTEPLRTQKTLGPVPGRPTRSSSAAGPSATPPARGEGRTMAYQTPPTKKTSPGAPSHSPSAATQPVQRPSAPRDVVCTSTWEEETPEAVQRTQEPYGRPRSRAEDPDAPRGVPERSGTATATLGPACTPQTAEKDDRRHEERHSNATTPGGRT